MNLSPDQIFWLFAAAIGGFVILGLAAGEFMTTRMKTRAKLEQARAREETKRELAAYVAEGSITPDDAAKILAADASGIGSIKSKVQQCIEASAEAASRFAGGSARDARRAAREAVRECQEV